MSYCYKVLTRKPVNNSGQDYALAVMSLTSNSKTNESRLEGTGNLLFAKFRASELLVLDILNLETAEHHPSFIHHTFIDNKSPLTYTVGEIVRPDHYDPDMYLVCSDGIHYFRSIEAVISYIPHLMSVSLSYYPSLLLLFTGYMNYYDSDGNIDMTHMNGRRPAPAGPFSLYYYTKDIAVDIANTLRKNIRVISSC